MMSDMLQLVVLMSGGAAYDSDDKHVGHSRVDNKKSSLLG